MCSISENYVKMCYQGKWSSTQLNDRLPGAQVIVPSKVTRAVRVECHHGYCSVTVIAKPYYCHWTRSPAQLAVCSVPKPPQTLPAVETASQEQDEQIVTLQRLLVLQLRTAYLHSSVINASMVAYYGCLLWLLTMVAYS